MPEKVDFKWDAFKEIWNKEKNINEAKLKETMKMKQNLKQKIEVVLPEAKSFFE